MGARRILIILTLCLLLVSGAAAAAYADTEYDSYDVYLDGKSTGESGFYIKGNTYLPISMIGTFLRNEAITVDSANMRLSFDPGALKMMMADDETTAFVQKYAGTVYIPLKKINDTVCFSLTATEQLYHTTSSISGSRIRLKAYDGTAVVARVGESSVRAVSSLFSDSQETITLSPGQRIFIEGETDHYYKFADFDGNAYYTLKQGVQVENIDLSKLDFYAPRKTKLKSGNRKINVAWQYVNEVTPEAPAKTSGIDIMAPTWFRLVVEGGGSVTNSGDKGYSDLCHARGFKVWSTITNNMSAKGSTNFTTKMFGTDSIQKRAIAQYLFYSCLYDTDGINIDFEDVRDADRDGLTAFTKELRYYTEKQGLNLSIDTLVPRTWTIEYDRAALSRYVDYLAVMSYDEHYAGSTIPGSVSSLPYTIDAIEKCLEEGVPASKLLMGVPLYTRVWVVDPNGKILSNSAVTMTRMAEILRTNQLSLSYLSKEMQNYVEYPASNGTAKVWLEDSTSITNRLSLVHTYGIAGSACWQYSQGTSEIWDLFDRYLH